MYKRTKKSNIYCLPCSKEAKQKLNRNNKDVQIVYAKMCTAQVISDHILFPFRASSISHYSSEQGQPKHFQKNFLREESINFLYF